VWAYYPIPGLQEGHCDYILIRINRESGLVSFAQTYDIGTEGNLCSGRSGAQLAEDLNASNADSLVIVFTQGNPLPNRLKNGLPIALMRCGSSPTIFANNKKFVKGCAYMLIGIPTCGEGNGFEVCQGGGAHSVVDVSFEITEGGWRMCDVVVDKVDDSWCIGSQSYLLSALRERTEAENFNWKQRQKESMPSYFTLCRLEYEAMMRYVHTSCMFEVLCCCKPVMKGPCLFLVLFGLGHLLTEIGRRAWYLVIWKFVHFLQAAVGIWTDELVDAFKVHEAIRAMSVVWDKPVKKRSKRAYETYRLSVAAGVREEEMTLTTTSSDVESGSPGARASVVTRKVRTKSIAAPKRGKSVHVNEESAEQQEVQLEELKRKLRYDYSVCLAAMVTTRVVLLQVVPQLTLLSIYCSIMSYTPIMIFSKRLRENMPELIISNPFVEARAQEQEIIDETEWIRKTEMSIDQNCIPNPKTRRVGSTVVNIDESVRQLIETKNAALRKEMTDVLSEPARSVNEWMVLCNGYCMLVLESRAIAFVLNLYKFALTVGLLVSPPEYLIYWMLSALIIVTPYCFVIGLKCAVILGVAMDITDDDLGRALRCIGMGWCFKCVVCITGSNKKLSDKSDAQLYNEARNSYSSQFAEAPAPQQYLNASDSDDEAPPSYDADAGDIEMTLEPPVYETIDRGLGAAVSTKDEAGDSDDERATWQDVSADVVALSGKGTIAGTAAGGKPRKPKKNIPLTIEEDGRLIDNESAIRTVILGPRNLDGVLHGESEIHFTDGSLFRGFYFKGAKHGKGVLREPNGTHWSGNFRDGYKDGEGVVSDANGKEISRGNWFQNRKI
jgi:hypothetical protein